MKKLLASTVIALGYLLLPASADAQTYCFAGEQCPQTWCWQCDIDEAGFGACQPEPQGGLRCACHVSNRHCVMSGPPQCLYGRCGEADGTGPCLWNAPPARSAEVDTRVSTRPVTSDAGSLVTPTHASI